MFLFQFLKRCFHFFKCEILSKENKDKAWGDGTRLNGLEVVHALIKTKLKKKKRKLPKIKREKREVFRGRHGE